MVILGSGLGGVAAANELRRHLSHPHRIVVIDREARGAYPPSYLWLMTGERRPGSISRQRHQLSRRGIEFVQAEIRQIDLQNRRVRADSRELTYDYLILALGAESHFEPTPGVADSGADLTTFEGAERLSAALRYFRGGRVLIAVAASSDWYMPAPYEAAMLLEHHFHGRRMRQKVDVTLVTPEPAPLAFAGFEPSEEMAGLLAHRGVAFRPDNRLAAVDTNNHEAHMDNGDQLPFDLLITVPRRRAPEVVLESGLMDASGWVPVNPASFETSEAGVFAIGDVSCVTVEDGSGLPRAGVIAARQGIVVARQIAYREGGRRAPHPLDGRTTLYLETGGGAAAALSGDLAGPGQGLGFKQPSIFWHLAKVAAEKKWLMRTY